MKNYLQFSTKIRFYKRAIIATLTTAALITPPAIAGTFHGHWIGGAIEATYHRLGGWNHFGDALNDESVSANNGRFQHFANNKSIYWHPNVDNAIAHAVEGRIRDKWADLGWENSSVGYPITDELTPLTVSADSTTFKQDQSIGLRQPMRTVFKEKFVSLGKNKVGKQENSDTLSPMKSLPRWYRPIQSLRTRTHLLVS
ncbi:hypothetical protein FRC0190_00032 [Corynebacterium rouxii]|uniref:Uncharacterized protein n=1 Tax=Corynebacterium rouxii TaxID=2719119 RepID=A0A6I8MEJ7_9CORY|nr:hypothetical protein FRC0190_00032 [Corynebacterium rouxii]